MQSAVVVFIPKLRFNAHRQVQIEGNQARSPSPVTRHPSPITTHPRRPNPSNSKSAYSSSSLSNSIICWSAFILSHPTFVSGIISSLHIVALPLGNKVSFSTQDRVPTWRRERQ